MSFWCSLKQRVGFTRAPLDRLNDDYSMTFDVSKSTLQSLTQHPYNHSLVIST